MIRNIKLKLGGEQRDFSFGIIFLGEVLERLDIDYNTMLNRISKNPFKYSPILMFESLKNTYKKTDKDIDFTENELVEWLEKEDNLGVDEMLKFINAFMGSQENKTPIEESQNGDVKKK